MRMRPAVEVELGGEKLQSCENKLVFGFVLISLIT
jgi:hypothetical protein